MQIEFFHDLAAMRVHRIHAEIQPGGDLFVGLAFGDQLQHLALAVGEQIDRIRDILPEIAQQRSRNFGADIAIAPRDRAHRIQQFRINRIFQNVAARSGLELLRQINGFTTVGRLANDLHIRMRGENELQSLPDNGVVIGKQNFYCAFGHLTSIFTPLPCPVSSENTPPQPRARISIPAKPSPPFALRAPGSNPRPLSRMVSRTSPLRARSSMLTDVAWEWRATFVSAS